MIYFMWLRLYILCTTAANQATAESVELQENVAQPSSDVQPAVISVFSEESQISSSLYDVIEDPPPQLPSNPSAERPYLQLFHFPDGMMTIMMVIIIIIIIVWFLLLVLWTVLKKIV